MRVQSFEKDSVSLIAFRMVLSSLLYFSQDDRSSLGFGSRPFGNFINRPKATHTQVIPVKLTDSDAGGSKRFLDEIHFTILLKKVVALAVQNQFQNQLAAEIGKQK